MLFRTRICWCVSGPRRLTPCGVTWRSSGSRAEGRRTSRDWRRRLETRCLPEAVRELGGVLLEQIAGLKAKILELDRRLQASAADEEAKLMSIPGIGPITASAIQAFAPPVESFRRGRDFSAWLGLVPRQHSTGGKPRLGRTSKMGQRDVRRLLITGAIRWRLGYPAMRRRVPRARPDACAKASYSSRWRSNIASIAWALMRNRQVYREPAPLV